MKTIALRNMAYARSGDKGTNANIGVIAFTEKGYRFLENFLTEEKDIINYMETVQQGVKDTGILVIGTFSEDGPKKCSGIDVKQYNETNITNRLKLYFEKIKCINVDHRTPFNSVQNFIFCSFRKSLPLE